MQREVRFCYRKIISSHSDKPWEKLVFEDSYTEFRIQMQNFEQYKSYPSYGDLIYYSPDAKTLPARVAPSVTGYIKQFNNIIPDILNNLGRRFLCFDRFQFEIINSHFELKERHQIAINFYSEPYIWHEKLGNYIVLSLLSAQNDGPILTETLQFQPYLSIYSIHEHA